MSAERGHRVTLFERETVLGGAVRVAAASPHRATLIDIVDYLDRETRRLKVDVNLGADISADDLEEIRGIADHVVMATGSKVAPLPSDAGRSAGAVSRRRRAHRRPPKSGRPARRGLRRGRRLLAGLQRRRGAGAARLAGHLRDRADRARAARPRARASARCCRRLGDAGVALHVATPAGRPGRRRRDPLVLRPVFGGADLEVEPASLVWHQPRIGDDVLACGTPAERRRYRDRRLRDPAPDQPCDRRGLPARGDRLMSTTQHTRERG